MNMAQQAALRGDCSRRTVGAVLVWDKRIWATGYNGTIGRGMAGCLEGACPRGRFTYEELRGYQQGNQDYSDCIARHAEINALRQFQVVRGSLDEESCPDPPIMYISAAPCNGCIEEINAARISYFYYVKG